MHSLPAAAVIDTNIWLDLFVFEDPRAATLLAELREGRIQAVRCDATDHEIGRVMLREQFRDHELAPRMQAWQALATRREPDRIAPWKCTDPDDQKFLDLAVSADARYLFTKDRALLRLAPRARHVGLVIGTTLAEFIPAPTSSLPANPRP